jgi:hypothetical protein
LLRRLDLIAAILPAGGVPETHRVEIAGGADADAPRRLDGGELAALGRPLGLGLDLASVGKDVIQRAVDADTLKARLRDRWTFADLVKPPGRERLVQARRKGVPA